MKDNNEDNLLNNKKNHSNTSTMINNNSTIVTDKKDYIVNSTDNSTNTGNDNGSLERFNERLKNASRSKDNKINKETFENKYKGKVDVYAPRHVGIESRNNKGKKIEDKIVSKDDISNNKSSNDIIIDNKDIVSNRAIDNKNLENKYKDVDVYKKSVGVDKSFKDNKKSNKSKYVGIITRKDVSGLSEEAKEERLTELEKEILFGLDTKLGREIDNLKELMFEHNSIVDYLNNQELISQEEIKEKIDELEKILKKVKFYIEQVEILNKNYRFEDIINLTEFSDQNIINDIVEYRDILESNNDRSKNLSDKYKMLENFIILYREVYLNEELLKYNKFQANEKLEETVDRDKKYDKLKDDVNNIEQIDSDCKVIIDKQNEYLRALSNRISNIDSHMVTRLRFDGINNMLLATLMYINIMNRVRFANPAVRGLTTVRATRRLLRNLYRNMPRFVDEMEYSADDLSRELYLHLDDVEIMNGFMENALNDVYKMKEQFDSEFNGKVPGYEEIKSKLDKIEESITDNKKKLDLVHDDINRNLVLNDRKLSRVRDLNQSAA